MTRNLLASTIDVEDLKNPDWRTSTAEPTAWIQESGRVIRVNGTVPAGQGFLVGYLQKPTAMASDTDYPDHRIPSFFHQYLKYAAAAWLLTQSGNAEDAKLASEMFGKFTTLIGVGPIPLASRFVRR